VLLANSLIPFLQRVASDLPLIRYKKSEYLLSSRFLMKRARVFSLALSLLLFCSFSIGCARQFGMQETAPSAANFVTGDNENNNGSPLPFGRATDLEGVSPSASLRAEEIPAGTLVSVRLLSHVSSAKSRAGDIFNAALAEPLFFEGQKIATEGTPLTGAIITTVAAVGTQQPGYLRLALTTIKISGQIRPIETSGVFVNGRNRYSGLSPSSSRPIAVGARLEDRVGDVELAAGRLLTFRLTQPLSAQN
jgi:hypothetical protein